MILVHVAPQVAARLRRELAGQAIQVEEVVAPEMVEGPEWGGWAEAEAAQARLARLTVALDRALAEAALLNAIAKAAAGEDDLNRILKAALDHLSQLINFTGGSLALVERNDLVIRAAVGPMTETALGQRLPRGSTGPSWRVIETGETFLCNDLLAAGYKTPVNSAGQRLQSYLAVPLIWRGKVCALLEIDSIETNAFRPEDASLLQSVAALLSGSVELAQRYRAEVKALAQVSHERARLHSLFMEAPAVICILRGPDHVVELANPLTMQIVGDREMIGIPLREALPELEEQGFISLLDRVFASGIAFQGNEVRVHLDRRGDGSAEELFFNFVYQPISDGGAVTGIMIHAVEVTEQVRARRQVEALASEHDAILRQTVDGVIVADAEGRITFINEAARRLHGIAALGVPIDRYSDVYRLLTIDGSPFPPDELPLARAVRGETVRDAEWRIRRPDGSEIIAQGSATPVYAENGSTLGAVLTLRDVTEQRLLEQQKDEFLAMRNRALAAAEAAEQRSAFLAEASSVLASSLDYETTLASVARLAVPYIADWCSVEMCDEGGGPIRQIAIAHVDPAKIALAHELRRRYPVYPETPGGLAEVIRTGEAKLIPEISDALLVQSARGPDHAEMLRALGLHSWMCVAIKSRGRVVGAIAFVASGSGRRFGPADLALAEALASRAALAIENAQLYRELRQFQRTLDDTLDCVFIYNPETLRFLYVNQGAVNQVGYSRDELLRMTPVDIKPDYDEARFRALIAPLLDGRQQGLTFEAIHRHKNGTEVPVEIALQYVAPDGEPGRFVSIVRDITERRQTEAALRQRAEALAQTTAALARSNRELDQFAYAASHDLKAPLRGIANLAQWIEEDLDPLLTGETRRHMELLRGRVQRMEALIDGLLQFSRVGRERVVSEPVDVGQLVADVIDLLAPPASFTIEVAPDLPTLLAPRLPLHQVFANLIGNAVKHHHRTDGTVSVTGRDLGSRFEFAVRDDGPGIGAAYHEKIFHIFQTLAPRDQVEGTGVGLALVKRIVESQGGTITVESNEGAGATFRFTWPKRASEQPDGRKEEGSDDGADG